MVFSFFLILLCDLFFLCFFHSNNSYFNNFWVGFVSRFDFLVRLYSISFMFDQCLIFILGGSTVSGVLSVSASKS